MNLDELNDLVNIELNYLDITLNNIIELNDIICTSEPDKFQLAAMTKLISDFYNGIENILKRFCKYLNVALQIGGFYHTELFLLFSEPPKENCPILFDNIIFLGI